MKAYLDPYVSSQCDYIKADYLAFNDCVDHVIPPAPAGPCSEYWQTTGYEGC